MILIIVLLITIGQTFFSINSLYSNPHISLAQSTNATSVFVPSNMNRMQITSKNDQSTSPSSIFENPLLIALISGLTAIFGGFMGSYMTNRSNRQLENERNKREKERQEEIERNVRALMLHNLKSSLHIITRIKITEPFQSAQDLQDFKFPFETYHKEYAEMSLEMKTKCFKPDVLTGIQRFYDFTDVFFGSLQESLFRQDEFIKTGGRLDSIEQDALNKSILKISNTGRDKMIKFAKEATDLLDKNI